MATKTKTTAKTATAAKTEAAPLTAAQRLAAKFDAITPEQKATATKVGAGVIVGGILGALLAS
jgi:hypothetical protein